MLSFTRKCQCETRLVGKTVVITGANTGIGKETARDLYKRGAKVIVACRNIEKANTAVEELKTEPPSKSRKHEYHGNPGKLVVCKLDLSSFASIRACANHLLETEPNIHILINNAAVVTRSFEKTEDGFECQFQTNYLGHFLLTLMLFPKLRLSSHGVKIINVASISHYPGDIHFEDVNFEKSYSPAKAYCQSKLANILFTRELARRLNDARIEGISVYSLDPGIVRTDIARNWDTAFFRLAKYVFGGATKPFFKTPKLGAQTTLYCALDEKAAKQSGLFYKECSVMTPSRKARNDELALRLWNESLKFVGLEAQDNLEPFLAKSILPRKFDSNQRL